MISVVMTEADSDLMLTGDIHTRARIKHLWCQQARNAMLEADEREAFVYSARGSKVARVGIEDLAHWLPKGDPRLKVVGRE